MVNQMMNRMWPKGNDYLAKIICIKYKNLATIIFENIKNHEGETIGECWPKGNVKV